ncbi:S41 family peptidase [Granulicella sp. dw_53]|uniref:S41 family peptidase n=1 Tax=Granulicella sp. dw_53 TaxID=2719792 RepID=UPI001BD1F31C|nr:S41 family peptidase [Granulicella sp. dw_53]
MAPRSRRALFSVTLFLGTCAVFGTLVNQKVAAQSATDESTLRDSLRSFTSVYSLVEQNYADKLDSDKTDKAIYDGAIPGMLHTLDPHSNFYDPKAFAQMREDQHGKYYGVGMQIRPQPDKNGTTKIVVLNPFEDTPSYKAGIRPGDVIVSIDGKSTTGMDSTAVASLLKGPKGTHVSVTMEREGAPKPLVFDLVRDEIPRYSVDLAFQLKPGVGYIHVTNFMETTSREVGDALDKFQAAGELKGLVLDLRGNPGGLLNEAVNMSDKFLQKGQIVVSQRGRAFPDQVYRAAHGEQGSNKYPIVVLVNRNTASAAEIVSGALQDHDRALIVGETTFGKGLVQTVFQITENTGLALTTYHYYTPSGRLIQRNYDHVSLYDYYYVRDAGKEPKDKSNLEVKLTDAGRTVYGGGGISPDEKIDNVKSNQFQDSLLQHYAFFDFSKHYLATHTVQKDFAVDDTVLQEFKAFLKNNNITYTDNDIAGVSDWVKESIKSDIFTSQFGQLEGLKVRAQWDPQIAKAITFLPQAEALEEHLKLAQKTTTTASR